MMYYYSLNEYLKKRFGVKVYKLALSGGMTCPNRDGTVGSRGCIFCSESGSGEFCGEFSGKGSILSQIEEGKKRLRGKIKDGKYIAYFQNFSNTYAPEEYLRAVFSEAINHPDIVALSVATRPDCISEGALRVLSEMKSIKPVFVELGLQTANEKTAEYIRRGYKTEVYLEAAKKLKKIGVEVVTHIIIGLPGETDEDVYETIKTVIKAKSDGIKIHLLYVVRGTDLEKDYSDGKFSVLSLPEYTRIVGECIKRLPRDMVIHRMTGDGAKRDLAAPLWSGGKKAVLNFMHAEFMRQNIEQGSGYNGAE